jgi:pyrroline-5-carboxylate reductase
MDSILICGCGNMGGAMLAGWLAAGLDPARFTVVDPVLAKAPGGVRLLREVPAETFDFVLLGIKPQALGEVAPALEPATRGAIVLSILAGAELATLAERFPAATALVRVMPNLAAAIGKSPLGLFAQGLDDAGRAGVQALLAPLGTAEWLASEDQLDAVTALAGSGPAFVYRFIAALAEGGAALGLDPAQADRLARAMVEGAALLAADSPETPAELAWRVTSPGGTTAAGLAVLDADEALLRLIEQTLRAARDRGSELAAAARG